MSAEQPSPPEDSSFSQAEGLEPAPSTEADDNPHVAREEEVFQRWEAGNQVRQEAALASDTPAEDNRANSTQVMKAITPEMLAAYRRQQSSGETPSDEPKN